MSSSFSKKIAIGFISEFSTKDFKLNGEQKEEAAKVTTNNKRLKDRQAMLLSRERNKPKNQFADLNIQEVEGGRETVVWRERRETKGSVVHTRVTGQSESAITKQPEYENEQQFSGEYLDCN